MNQVQLEAEAAELRSVLAMMQDSGERWLKHHDSNGTSGAWVVGVRRALRQIALHIEIACETEDQK